MARNKYKKRRDGFYETKITIGYADNGTRIRLSLSADSSQALEDKVYEYKTKLKQLKETLPTANALDYKYMLVNNVMVLHSDMLLSDYANEWFLLHKSHKEINTQAMYKNIIEKHINPSIGYLPINSLRHSDIQKMLTERYDKPRTCQQILLVLKQIFCDLKRDKLITTDLYENLIDKYDLSKYTPRKKRALTKLEKDAILSADFTDNEKAFVMILFYFGIRREEILALNKSDFDFENKLLHINRAIVYDGNNPVLKDPKSFAGKRSIYIPEAIYDFLNSFITACTSIYIFTKKNGDLMTKSSYTKMWSNIIKKINAEISTNKNKHLLKPTTRLTAHIFRHNYCTMLYYSGISVLKAVELMGHTDKKMILDVYAHLDEEKENAVEKINNTIKLEKAL